MFQRFQVSVWIFIVTVVVGMVAMPALTQPRYSRPAVSPVQDNQSILVLPYIAVGGLPESWHFLTVVSLENPNSSEMSGAVEFFTNDGAPLHLQLNDGPEMAATTEWKLPARESTLLVLTHPGNDLQAGWLRVKLAANSPVDVIVLIQFYNGEELVKQVAVVASPGPGEGRLASYHMLSPQTGTPLLLNPNDGPMNSLLLPSPKRRIEMLGVLPLAKKAAQHVSLTRPVPAVPRAIKRAFTQNGFASWYGYPFHGCKAADGKIYDQFKLTAAHRTLPLGTRARITNLRNHRSVTVRITDRGPYVPGRIIDLSLAAARELDIVKSGVSPVRLELLPS